MCVLGRPKNSRVINKLAQQIVRIPNFRSEKQLVRLGVEMIYLVSVSARLQSSFFFIRKSHLFNMRQAVWCVTFCGMVIILHSFNNNFVNAVANIVTRGRIPTLQRPPFDLNCIFAENYEIKALPDTCNRLFLTSDTFPHMYLYLESALYMHQYAEKSFD